MEIPVIDFAECGLLKTNDDTVDEESLSNAGCKLYRAFAEVGFAYVINSGISNEIITKMGSISDAFFSLSSDEKLKFFNKKMAGICYDPVGFTHVYKNRPCEKVEALRIAAYSDDTWPEIPGLKETSLHFQNLCKILTLRILKALGRGMELKDVDLFSKGHKLLNLEGNSSQLKLSLYPAIPDEIDKGSLRLADHTDIGSLTLLFHEEDAICGLQAESASGMYVDIKQVPNAILLTVGDQLRFWTGERLRSVKHRVIVPDDVKQRLNARKSIAYFTMVDDETKLEELEFNNSENKPAPSKTSMTGKQYVTKRFNELYVL